MHMDRRRFLIGTMGLAGAAALGACTSDGGSSGPDGGGGAGDGAPTTLDDALVAPGTAGLVDEAAFQERATAYLAAPRPQTLAPVGTERIYGETIGAAREYIPPQQR